MHWPFCQAKCPYCDFNSHVQSNVDQAVWRQALSQELHAAKTRVAGRTVTSVFFGGGTPSLMEAQTVDAVLNCIESLWGLDTSAEISLEANPTSVEAGRFSDYRLAGVNRISLGVQALNDPDLKRLGRLHSALDAQNAFSIAQSVFDRVSFDLIYARQGQTLKAWESELKQALDMAVDHLSLYQLTIEPETRFGELHAKGRLRDLPVDDQAAEMYFITQDLCANAGMPAYEISNHAGQEAQSRHNLLYWRGGEYIGIGPGAHGREVRHDTLRWAVETIRQPQKWLTSIEVRGHGLEGQEALTPQDQAIEYLMMSLRLSEGSDIERYNALADKPLSHLILKELRSDGLVEYDHSQLRVTSKGRPVLNAILRSLLS